MVAGRFSETTKRIVNSVPAPAEASVAAFPPMLTVARPAYGSSLSVIVRAAPATGTVAGLPAGP